MIVTFIVYNYQKQHILLLPFINNYNKEIVTTNALINSVLELCSLIFDLL